MILKDFLDVCYGRVSVQERDTTTGDPDEPGYRMIGFANPTAFEDDDEFMEKYGDREVNAIHMHLQSSGLPYAVVRLKDKE